MVSARTRARLRQLFVIMGIACSVVPVFNLLTNVPSLRQIVHGAVDAAVITLMVGGYILFLRDGALRPWFRRLEFITDLLLNSLILVALFLVGRATGQAIAHLESSAFWLSFRDPHMVFALPFFVVLAFSIQFVRQMNRMIGANVLAYFVAGVYRQPKDEQRIFLFVDLAGSTRIAEQLGSARYFELLRRFADDVGAAALATAGQIYQYVGDEVVVTWPQVTGLRHAHCVRCFFALGDEVARHAARYEREFGLVPRFQGGLHGGHVTAGEIGDLHQQIVYVGDILNTAARLQEHAKRSGFGLVVSGSLLQQLDLPADISARPCGELALRGKDAPVAAFSVSPRAAR